MLGVDEKKIDGIPAQRARNRENVSSPKASRELSAIVIVLKTEYKKPLRRFIASRSETPSCVWEADMPSWTTPVVLCNDGYLSSALCTQPSQSVPCASAPHGDGDGDGFKLSPVLADDDTCPPPPGEMIS